MKSSYLCSGLYVDPRFACPNFSGILEALCSFLQAENVGNFQSLQKSFEKARVPNGHTQIHEDGHSGFTHYCVELLNEHHLVYFGYFLRPSA